MPREVPEFCRGCAILATLFGSAAIRPFPREVSMARVIAAGIRFSLLLTAFLSTSLQFSLADPLTETDEQEVVAPVDLPCLSSDPAVPRPDNAPGATEPCTNLGQAELAGARTFLLETARIGNTMLRQGPELAIARLHPQFVIRLAAAIREAREAGLSAGIFSAYRPPVFGVGGFSDKFNSLHSYGLAVDMYGVGSPGSAEANRWHEVAARHGIVCPYGPRNRTEWNHCQPTSVKKVVKSNPLRETITAEGPRSLEDMFTVGSTVIANTPESVLSLMSRPGLGEPPPQGSTPEAPHIFGSSSLGRRERVSMNAARSGFTVRRAHSRAGLGLSRQPAGEPPQLQSATVIARARLKRLSAEYARTDWARHIAVLRRTRARTIPHPAPARAAAGDA
jgi:hypothetical protein